MANETVAIAHRWLDLITDEIGEAKIALIDLYLDDARTFRIRPDEVEEYPEELTLYLDTRDLGDLAPGDERHDDIKAFVAQIELGNLERESEDHQGDEPDQD
jgi:hypothetical protein